MGNHVPMEHHVVGLETNTFVSVLREKKEQTVWKKVRRTFKFVADKKPLPLHLIHFAIFPGLHTLNILFFHQNLRFTRGCAHLFIDTPHEDHCFRNLVYLKLSIPDIYATYL